MLAAPRAKRQRERSLSPPPSTPDGKSASPIDQLVKRRRRGLGVHGDAHGRSMSTSSAPMGMGMGLGPTPVALPLSAPYATFDGQTTPEATDGPPALYRSVSDPTITNAAAYTEAHVLQTPTPAASNHTNQEEGGGRNRVQRYGQTGWTDEDKVHGGEASSSPAVPAESAYTRSNALLHELHLARLQPLPSPGPHPDPASSSPFHTHSSPSFLARAHSQQYISTTPPNWTMRDSSTSIPTLSTSNPSARYPYLSRHNSSETEMGTEDSSDVDAEMDGEGRGQTISQSSSGSLQPGPARHMGVTQPTTPYRQAANGAADLSHRRIITSSSRLSTPHQMTHTPRLEISRTTLGRAHSTGVQVQASAVGVEEAARTRRQYQEANELLGRLVLGRRSVTEAVVRRPGKL